MADNVYNLKFTLSNGDVIDAGQITAPQGPKGDKGDSATINADTLNGLLSGNNGIAIAKNATGDKVEVKIPNEIIISNSQGTAKLSPQTISLFFNSENVGFLIDAIAGGMYKTSGSEQQWFLHQGNVKTLFGNQSIYGSGNIDLYKHNLHIVGTTSGYTDIYCQITSSNNLNIDSLTDLQTILADNEWVCAFGLGRVWSDASRPVCGISKTYVYAIHEISGTPDSLKVVTWDLLSSYSSGLTFTDTVTTV